MNKSGREMDGLPMKIGRNMSGKNVADASEEL